MTKLVCLDCQVEFRIEKNGVLGVDMFLAPPQPYQIYDCDAWKCPGCGRVILAGFSDFPFAKHFEPGFLERLNGALARSKDWVIAIYEKVGDKEKYGNLPTSSGT